ncbi:trypsin-like serine protease [Vibrio owensii]|uniref:trypsin-like serine protease n=1 Tax=Vibrio owensii TaxID=696485 RepID=UPI0038CE1C75
MRFTYLALSTLMLLPLTSHAVVNGNPVSWDQYDDTVRLDNSTNMSLYCTATLISGRYAITAGHCVDDGGLDIMVPALGDGVPLNEQWKSPEYTDEYGRRAKDVGIVRVDTPIDYRHIQFLNIDEHSEGEPIVIRGFGSTIDTLNQAEFTFSHYNYADHYYVYADTVNESHTTGGDSGAAWTISDDSHEEIFAIHRGSARFTTGERETYGTTIQSVQNFISETIDGWHYPTLADTDENGKATITIQSLHRDDVVDTAWGDNVTITGGTCLDGLINPFEKCTYLIESNGGEGKLFLSDSESIHINKPQDNSGGGNNSSGDSGGSMGIWALMLLGLANLRRKH